MKVLVITYFDADNLRIVNVLKELKQQGHQLGIYCRFMDEQNIRMLRDLQEPLHRLNNLNSGIVNQYDVIFSALHGQGWLKFYNKYMFFFNHYFDDHWLTQGADFMFTVNGNRILPYREDCSTMPVGDPKNDTIISMAESNSCQRILYIDTGHYPFGRKGKEQIADMLINICRSFPDYELCIKPRWLPENNDNVTHRNSMHIYSIIAERSSDGIIPSNLNMLQEHYDMQQLLDESICAITTISSAYIDVVLRGKNIIIVEGFDNDDKFDARNDIEIKESYDQKRSSGCVIHYKDIIQYLPQGLKCSSAHIDSTIAYRTGASKRIVEVMEYIFENYLRHGKFPSQKDYCYDNYRLEMDGDNDITYAALQTKRMKNCVLEKLAIKFFITAPLDFSSFYNQLQSKYMTYSSSKYGFNLLAQDLEKEKRRIIINGRELLMDDSINQSRLLQTLYESEEYEQILNMSFSDILCTGPYHYYMGLILANKQRTRECIYHLMLFFKEANERSYEKYPQETKAGLQIAYRQLFSIYDGSNIAALDFFQLYSVLYEHKLQTMIPSVLLNKVESFLPVIGQQLYVSGHEKEAVCCMFKSMEYMQKKIVETQRLIPAYHRNDRRLLSKVRGGLMCIQDHGVRYTIVLFIKKINGKFRRASQS